MTAIPTNPPAAPAAEVLRYHIRHATRYTYSAPVSLNQTVLRLQPRTDTKQRLNEFSIQCDPRPTRHTHSTDLHGNIRHWFWFEDAHEKLEIVTTSVVDCLNANPFDFVLVDDGAKTVPVRYRDPVGEASNHYRIRDVVDPEVNAFVNDVLATSDNDTLAFLWELAQTLHRRIAYEHREEGLPWTPQKTLTHGRGSCRDTAVLFVDCCRAVGLAARFVSGYAYAAVSDDRRDLHAWGEVYLPGGGWRGYDPTIGLAVSNEHIAVAASPSADYAAPFTGTFSGPAVESELTFDLKMQQTVLPARGVEDASVYRWR